MVQQQQPSLSIQYLTKSNKNSSQQVLGSIFRIFSKYNGKSYINASNNAQLTINNIVNQLINGNFNNIELQQDWKLRPYNFEAEDLQLYYSETDVPVLIRNWKLYFGGKDLINLYNKELFSLTDVDIYSIMEENKNYAYYASQLLQINQQLNDQVIKLNENLAKFNSTDGKINQPSLTQINKIILSQMEQSPIKVLQMLTSLLSVVSNECNNRINFQSSSQSNFIATKEFNQASNDQVNCTISNINCNNINSSTNNDNSINTNNGITTTVIKNDATAIEENNITENIIQQQESTDKNTTDKDTVNQDIINQDITNQDIVNQDITSEENNTETIVTEDTKKEIVSNEALINLSAKYNRSDKLTRKKVKNKQKQYELMINTATHVIKKTIQKLVKKINKLKQFEDITSLQIMNMKNVIIVQINEINNLFAHNDKQIIDIINKINSFEEFVNINESINTINNFIQQAINLLNQFSNLRILLQDKITVEETKYQQQQSLQAANSQVDTSLMSTEELMNLKLKSINANTSNDNGNDNSKAKAKTLDKSIIQQNNDMDNNNIDSKAVATNLSTMSTTKKRIYKPRKSTKKLLKQTTDGFKFYDGSKSLVDWLSEALTWLRNNNANAFANELEREVNKLMLNKSLSKALLILKEFALGKTYEELMAQFNITEKTNVLRNIDSVQNSAPAIYLSFGCGSKTASGNVKRVITNLVKKGITDTPSNF